jgi:hypothetical protein
MNVPEPKGAERRRHPRAPLDWPITISLPDGDHEARLRDVSRSGVCFFLDRRIPEMTVLRMELDLPIRAGDVPGADPKERHVGGTGVVVRCQPLSPHVDHFEIAIFLNEITDEDRERLESYVSAGVARA